MFAVAFHLAFGGEGKFHMFGVEKYVVDQAMLRAEPFEFWRGQLKLINAGQRKTGVTCDPILIVSGPSGAGGMSRLLCNAIMSWARAKTYRLWVDSNMAVDSSLSDSPSTSFGALAGRGSRAHLWDWESPSPGLLALKSVDNPLEWHRICVEQRDSLVWAPNGLRTTKQTEDRGARC